MQYDFSPSGPDAGATYRRRGLCREDPQAYGPSSAHPSVDNAGMADGSVRSLSKRIDARLDFSS